MKHFVEIPVVIVSISSHSERRCIDIIELAGLCTGNDLPLCYTHDGGNNNNLLQFT